MLKASQTRTKVPGLREPRLCWGDTASDLGFWIGSLEQLESSPGQADVQSDARKWAPDIHPLTRDTQVVTVLVLQMGPEGGDIDMAISQGVGQTCRWSLLASAAHWQRGS